MMEAQRETYMEEAHELLSELETSLMAMEEAPDDDELIGRVFRALHTIKGSGAMFGFDDIAAFTHEIETVFDLVRCGKMTVTRPLVDLTLAAGDHIRTMLDGSRGGPKADEARAAEILESLRMLVPGQAESACAAPQSPAFAPPAASSEEEETVYRIFLRLEENAFHRGTNPILLLNELRELGHCQVIAHTEAIPDLEGFDPEACYLSWDVILTTNRGINAIKDVFIFVEDECELDIKVLDETEDVEEAGGSPKKLGEILVERGNISPEDLERTLNDQKRIGELLVDAGLVEPSRVESALAEQEYIRTVRANKQKEALTSSIRVPAERLDTLINLVGELVTVQARLSQTAASMEDPEMLSIAEEVERLTAELRDNTMSIRMLPIGTTFSKFKRLVRDLSAELRKDVLLVTEGAETELDKTVIERLNDPLVHLIRNSIDHGVESPEARAAAGKPRQGTVRLAATHSGANVLITITDDGAGLDANAIKAKAVERGLIPPDLEMSENEVFSLIFTPGFSTAREITNVSGRGVGMDVVKRSIEALRGSIDINSAPGAGTVITLKLPLTLAIIDGLLVQIGDERFVLPLSSVEECVELTREDVKNAHGRRITYVRGSLVPYVRLRESFSINGTAPDPEQIVITETAEGRAGFVVDKVIGQHQTVIKNLGRMYRDVEGISGATILGDGTVALILDISHLLRNAESERRDLRQGTALPNS